MKPHFCVFLALSYTFLASLAEVHSQESTQEPAPEFLEKPAETYYLVRRKPVLLACEAARAVRVTFQCNGQDVPPDSVRNYDRFDPSTGSTVIRSLLEVSRQDLEDREDRDFWCECLAWSTPQGHPQPSFIRTRRAKVQMAYLKKKFTRDPSAQQTQVVWRKDGREVEAEAGRLEVTSEGSLVIRGVEDGDQGDYDCLAQNAAAKRVSRSARLTIHEPQMLVDGRGEEEEMTSADDPSQGLPPKPVFTEEPDSESFVAENKPVKLFCRVIGADILTFNCENRRVDRARTDVVETMDPGSRVRIHEGTFDVTPDLLRGDQYECKCVAWYTRPSFQGWRQEFSRAAVIRLASLEERFVVEPMSELVGVGDRLDLYCTPPRGSPEAKVRWTKDGSPVRSGRRYSVDAQGTLTINGVRRADAGSYVCIANNPANTRESSPAVITVSDEPVSRRTTPTTTRQTTPPTPDDEPVVTEKPDDTYYIFGDSVTASGVVRGADMVEVRCLGNRLTRRELQTDTQLDSATNKRILSFTFDVSRDAVVQERRPYLCTLHAWYVKQGESNWTVKDGADITFEIGRTGTQFQQLPKEQMVSAGETATFSCVPPSANPPFMVTWQFNSRTLQSSDRVMIKKDMLTISDVTESDAGEYTCRAEQEASGTMETRSAMLKVTPGDPSATPEPGTTMMPDQTDDDVITMETTTPRAGYPYFTLQPKGEYYLIRDSPAMITVAARDSQMITFECNGMRVARGEGPTRQVADSSGFMASEKMLTVSEAEFESFQGEEYRCLSRAYYTDPVTGSFDNITSDSFLVAKAYLRRNFQATPMSSVAALGSKVMLECAAPKGVPKPTVTWYKDNEILEDSEHAMTSEDGDLVIAAMRPEDAGSYVCVAENIFARRTTSPAQLGFIDSGVTPTPEPTTSDDMETSGTAMYDSPPVFVAQSSDVIYASETAPAQIMCEATNTMKITFTCNAQQVDESRVMTMEGQDEGSGRKTLVARLEVGPDEVLGAEDPDSFWCQCYAHYQVPGVSDPQYELGKRVYVRIAYLDDFDDMEDKEMVGSEGKTVSIPCQAPEGKPKPKISWMRNGQPLDTKADPNLQWPARGQLLIVSLGAKDVGIYKCVAENTAGERHSGAMTISIEGMPFVTPESEPEPTSEPSGMTTTSGLENASDVITTFEIDTAGTTDEEEGVSESTAEPFQTTAEPTGEPEDQVTDDDMMTAKPKDCTRRIMECGVGRTPEELCASLEEYKACVESVITDCSGQLRQESIELAVTARDRLVQSCPDGSSPGEDGMDGMEDNDDNVINPGPGDVSRCPKLENCRAFYRSDDVNFACSGMESYLRCAHNAMELCGLRQGDVSLGDLADWSDMYCQKLVVGEGSMRNCEKYQSCQVPVNESLPTSTLVMVSHWCPHVHELMTCTKMAAAECEDSNDVERQSVFYELDQNALAMCPQAEVEGPPPASDPNIQQNPPENAAGGLTVSMVTATLVQLAMTLAFVLR